MEWNRMSEEFILKVYKSIWKHADTIIEKKKKRWLYWVNLLFDVYLLILLFIFFKLELNLFYNRAIYYPYTRIFLILLLHPVFEEMFLDKKLLNMSENFFSKSTECLYQVELILKSKMLKGSQI